MCRVLNRHNIIHDDTMDTNPEKTVIHRKFETDEENPSSQVAEVIAELENAETTELGPIWDCIDGVLDNLFSNPPDPQAQMVIKFSYEGYRISVSQDGNAEFMKVEQE